MTNKTSEFSKLKKRPLREQIKLLDEMKQRIGELETEIGMLKGGT
jgi:hypothetical protein